VGRNRKAPLATAVLFILWIESGGYRVFAIRFALSLLIIPDQCPTPVILSGKPLRFIL
jgi:hypothetical protein